MSEVYRYVYFTMIGLAIMAMISLSTMTMIIYMDVTLCKKLCDIVALRLSALVNYCYSIGNITVKLDLMNVINRPFELYIVNANTIRIEIPLKYFYYTKIVKYVRFSNLNINFTYVGLVPRVSYLYFLKINGTVYVGVKT